MPFPDYAKAEFLNSIVLVNDLQKEIEDAGPYTPAFLGILYDSTTCSVLFDAEPSAGEKTTIDSVVASHVGSSVDLIMLSPDKFVENEVAITETTSWQILGGVVTSPDFFWPIMGEITGHVTGNIKTNGTGVELRVCEDDGVGDVLMTNPVVSIPDTSDAWEKIVSFNTNIAPKNGQNTYRLEGRLNAATSASVRFVSMSLMRVVVSSGY